MHSLLNSSFWWLLVWFTPLCGLSCAACYLVSLPLRRRERARFFLDLIETGIRSGHSAERTIVSVADSRDESVGVRFHLLAAYLRSGLRLGDALDQVPRLLPPQISSTLRTGEKVGDIPRFVPACRVALGDAASISQKPGAQLMTLLFALLPVAPLLYLFVVDAVMPRFAFIIDEFEEPLAAPVTLPWMGIGKTLAWVQIAVAVVFFAAAFFRFGGPRLKSWMTGGWSPGWVDWVIHQIPWRRKQMLRDFTSVLASLLDHGVDEGRAVRLAAESTANLEVIRRMETVVRSLESGRPLPEALHEMDGKDELQWRFRNAARSNLSFYDTLRGWMDSLEGRAQRQEQIVSQGVTALVVLINGLLVGLLVFTVFDFLTRVIQLGVLW